jgi:DNA adenine methylase
MNPIIKWPGGKSSEFDYISNFFPKKYDRYVEPFFGGGAVFFKLEPRRSVINDICSELVNLYKVLADEKGHKLFSNCLDDYVSNWQKIPKYINTFEDEILDIYEKSKHGRVSDLHFEVSILIGSKIESFNGLFSENFCIDRKNLDRQIVNNLTSKLKRLAKIELEAGDFSKADIEKNIETAFRSGFYMHFRDILNNQDKYKIDIYKSTANFYFIREFCYGSMFRFNKEGKFNVPYGGIAYNTKNFAEKAKYVLSSKVHNILSKSDVYCDDFEKVLNSINLSTDDFLFLDPPYDTEFKDYNDDAFNKSDQQRLANFLYKTLAKFVLVIKNTEFIEGLYKDREGIKISKFDKSYQYNVKGRNNRDVEHLIIYNF